MKINKIKINSYGKLKEKEINLKNGINLIYGKNEAGKSTLINFLIIFLKKHFKQFYFITTFPFLVIFLNVLSPANLTVNL